MSCVGKTRTSCIEDEEIINLYLCVRSICFFLIGVVSSCLIGCGGGPSALEPPELDPEYAAEQAIELYDQDGDGGLSLEELKASPGILLSLEVYDENGDEKISKEEIAQRLDKFVQHRVTLARLTAKVRLDGEPLADATVRFIPEPYLGDEIKPATGVTKKRGSASMAVADEELPENQKGIRGIHPGTYRVEITHPKIKVPAKYNTSSTLGYETTPGNPYATFELQSR